MEALSDDESDCYVFGHKGLDGYVLVVNGMREARLGEHWAALELEAGRAGAAITELGAQTCAEPQQLRAALARLIAHGKRTIAPAEAREDKPIDDEAVMRYIDENAFDPNLSQALVAEAMYISVRTVLGIVKKRTGQTYIEYLTNLRMQRAKKLLAEEGLSVTETCERVCYASIPYFIRTFKSVVGETPAKYKRMKGRDDA